MTELKHDEWVGTTYGSGLMHRWLIKSLKVIDVRLLYSFAFIFVVPPTMVINSKARKAIYHFYRHRFGKWKSAWMTYKNHCAFATAVIDKFAMYAGRNFIMEVEGFEYFKALSEGEKGFIQVSSHIGNYELAGYKLKAENKRFNALVFGGEKESVMANRNRMFVDNNIRMITISDDMSHLFEINSALSEGEIVSLPADRIFGSRKCFTPAFFGKAARIPAGPFQVAAIRDVPMLFVSVMKSGAKSYKVNVIPVEIPADIPRRDKAAKLAESYIDILEATLEKYPSQWYNFFDFWNQ